MTKYEVCNITTGKCMKTFDNFKDANDYLYSLRNPRNHEVKRIGPLKASDSTTDKMNDMQFWNYTTTTNDLTSKQSKRFNELRTNNSFRNKLSQSSKKSNSKSSSMWRMSNKQIYDAIKSKSYSAKQRRFMSYILSTRRK